MELSSTFFLLIGMGVTIGAGVSVALIIRQINHSHWIDSRSRYMSWIFVISTLVALVVMWGSFLFFIA